MPTLFCARIDSDVIRLIGFWFNTAVLAAVVKCSRIEFKNIYYKSQVPIFNYDIKIFRRGKYALN